MLSSLLALTGSRASYSVSLGRSLPSAACCSPVTHRRFKHYSPKPSSTKGLPITVTTDYPEPPPPVRSQKFRNDKRPKPAAARPTGQPVKSKPQYGLVPPGNAKREPRHGSSNAGPRKSAGGSAAQDIRNPEQTHPKKADAKASSSATAGGLSETDVQEALQQTTRPGRDAPPHSDKSIQEHMVEVSRGKLNAKEIILKPVDDEKGVPVATLRKSLQRIPFNPGIQHMRDPRTGIWNYDPESLHSIPPHTEYAMHRQAPYFPPGEDIDLRRMAVKTQSRYMGSTSTLTKAFSQIYFALSGDRSPDIRSLSSAFATERTDFTAGARLPAVLRVGKSAEGALYIDSDKGYDIPNVLSEYGHMLERMLTSEPADFRRYLKSSPEESVSQAERENRGAFQYQKGASLLMRSQLDCYDPRLPGTGVFDIKTRACLSLRHDRANYEAAKEYDISTEKGYWNSFEREYFDLIKSAMLKFSFQVRIGMMDGVMLAYHNTDRMFGFQYLPLSEMDERLFGSSEMGESAFRLCVALFEALLDEIMTSFPDQTIRIVLKQNMPRSARAVTAFVQPADWEGLEEDKPIQAFSLSLANIIDNATVEGPVGFSVDEEQRKKQVWEVDYTIKKSEMDPVTQAQMRRLQSANLNDLIRMMTLNLPDGKSAEDMAESGIAEAANGDVTWRKADGRIQDIRNVTMESAAAYKRRVASWGDAPGNSWDPIQQ